MLGKLQVIWVKAMTEKLFRSVKESLVTERNLENNGAESLSNPFMSKEMRLKSLFRKKKDDISRYIEEKGSARTSEIAEGFNIDYKDAHYILKQLEKENRIVIE